MFWITDRVRKKIKSYHTTKNTTQYQTLVPNCLLSHQSNQVCHLHWHFPTQTSCDCRHTLNYQPHCLRPQSIGPIQYFQPATTRSYYSRFQISKFIYRYLQWFPVYQFGDLIFRLSLLVHSVKLFNFFLFARKNSKHCLIWLQSPHKYSLFSIYCFLLPPRNRNPLHYSYSLPLPHQLSHLHRSSHFISNLPISN